MVRTLLADALRMRPLSRARLTTPTPEKRLLLFSELVWFSQNFPFPRTPSSRPPVTSLPFRSFKAPLFDKV